ncbi:hypothetical protein [Shinella zoogloeoides]|uniref:hypothetical protein n=1 Tax=Shinella zoogloeoides TaxID=352475 RepID=UPI0028A735B6|nr:hypothetical protein [Shinella zoogloeoides]
MIRYATRPDPVAAIKAQPRRCARSVEDKLADVILELGHAGEPITEEALRQRGYSEAVVRRHGPAALAQARRRSIRRVAA